MNLPSLRRALLAFALLLTLAAVPALSSASPSQGRGADAAAERAADTASASRKKAKKRCRWVRVKGKARKRRVCKKPKRSQGASPPAPPIASPPPPDNGGLLPPIYDDEDPKYEPPVGPGEPGAEYERVDLISNNGFEDPQSPACFAPFSDNDGSVASTTANPIAGAGSLAVEVAPFGRVGCIHEYGFEEGPIGRSVALEGKLRIDAPASGEGLRVCVIVYFAATQEPGSQCRTLPLADHGVVDVQLSLDVDGKRLQRVFFQLEAGGTSIEAATLDDAHLYVDQLRGSEGPSGGGGGGGGGGGSACAEAIAKGEEPVPDGPPDPESPCDLNQTPQPGTSYQPAQLTLAAQRPFISIADYTRAPESSAIVKAFKQWVDRAVFQRNPGFAYTSTDAVIMFARTGNVAYIDDAIARVDAEVTAAEKAISEGETPVISHDSYLEIGGEMEALALTYDYGFARLTPQQRERWKAYADQAIANVWSPLTATWGTAPAGTFPWSAWAINDPGNNYNYSFIEATQMWALATQDQRWLDFLQKFKFPLMVDYHAELPGGGSREGTGYGTAQRRLWENARMWRGSTGEDLTAIRTHARESIEYWINATVPTLDHYAPIGDLSRQSVPELFDYQENLVREAIMAAPGTEAARHGIWWLSHNSVPETLTQGFTLRNALLQPVDTEQTPTALAYRAAGVGQFFARSSWSGDATWLQLTAGPYDQSHAHEDQGGFTLYRNTWLAVTSNIWSHSGLQGGGGGGGVADLDTGANNVVRFTRPGAAGAPPQTIRQNFSDSTMSFETLPGNLVKVHADLSDAYSNNADEVLGWTRDLEFQGNVLRVRDACQVAAGIGSVFQLHVPEQPVDHGGGLITAGALQVKSNSPAQVKLIDMRSFNPPPEPGGGQVVEFERGWRIDISNPNACAFDVTLTALSTP